MKTIPMTALAVAALALAACDGSNEHDAGPATPDAARAIDGGVVDAAIDPMPDGGTPSGDAAMGDTDAGADAGPPDRTLCERALAALDDERPLLAAPSATPADAPLRTLYVVPATGPEWPDVRSMQTHFKGFGFAGDWVYDSSFAATDLSAYSSIALLGSAWVEIDLGDAGIARVAAAIDEGKDVLWMGPGLPRELASRFGVRRVEEDMTTGTQTMRFVGTGGREVVTATFDEYFTPLALDGAEALATFEPSGRPAITAHRPSDRFGRAICVPFGLMHYWTEGLEPDAWARAELVFDALALLHSRGTVMIAPYPDGHASAFLVRFEDLNPGGTRYNTHDDEYVERFHRVIEQLGAMGIEANLGVVARYADPWLGEAFEWTSPSPGRERWRAAVEWALAEHGAELISHGFTHQYGTREEDYTGIDSEFSDDATGMWMYLPYDEQRMRIEAARDTLIAIFGMTPRVWETPHLDGNADTYRAAAEAGFAIINEGDGKLYPNRWGYGGLIGDLALNVPHTASYVPLDEGEALAYLDAAALSMLPRLVRIGAPFFLFYHGFVWGQENAMMRLAECADACALWTPTVSEYADWGVMRQATRVSARIESGAIHATITDHPSGATMRVRMPDGAEPIAARVDGAEATFETHRAGGVAWATVVLPSTTPTELEVRFAP